MLTLRSHFSTINNVTIWNLGALPVLITGLKILGFVNTGVPVQFRPGAPFPSEKHTFSIKNADILGCLKSGQKGPIWGGSVDTMKPLSKVSFPGPVPIITHISFNSNTQLVRTGGWGSWPMQTNT